MAMATMKKVLVVDDDPDDAAVIVQLLRSNDYEVDSADNGRDGLQKAFTYKPDLLILDLMMPGMHGFQVCEAIRADDKLKDLRIIIISGKRYTVDFRAADRLGANMFLPKPFEIEQMLAAVQAMIGRPSEPLPHEKSEPGPG